MATDTVVEKVGSVEVAPTDRITCEVCQADYHGVAGSKNDCPLCNAPGGKGRDYTAGVSLEGNPLSPIVAAMAKDLNALSARVAQLEADHKVLAEKAAA